MSASEARKQRRAQGKTLKSDPAAIAALEKLVDSFTAGFKEHEARISALEARTVAMDASILGHTFSAMVVLAFSHAVGRACGIPPAELKKHFSDVLAEMNLASAADPHIADITATLDKSAAKAPG